MYFEIQYWQETSESETCSDECYRDLFMSFEYIHYIFINIPVYGPSLVSAWHFRIVRKTNKIFITFANLAKTRKHLSLLRLSQNRYSQLRRYTVKKYKTYTGCPQKNKTLFFSLNIEPQLPGNHLSKSLEISCGNSPPWGLFAQWFLSKSDKPFPGDCGWKLGEKKVSYFLYTLLRVSSWLLEVWTHLEHPRWPI